MGKKTTIESTALTDHRESQPNELWPWSEFIQHHKRKLRLSTSQFAKHCKVNRESLYYWIKNPRCQPQERVRRRVEEAVNQQWAQFTGPEQIWETEEEPFAIVLREIIQDSGMRYDDISRRAGISSPNLYNWCAGLCYPTLTSLVLVIEVIQPRLPFTKGHIYQKLHNAMLRSL